MAIINVGDCLRELARTAHKAIMLIYPRKLDKRTSEKKKKSSNVERLPKKIIRPYVQKSINAKNIWNLKLLTIGHLSLRTVRFMATIHLKK